MAKPWRATTGGRILDSAGPASHCPAHGIPGTYLYPALFGCSPACRGSDRARNGPGGYENRRRRLQGRRLQIGAPRIHGTGRERRRERTVQPRHPVPDRSRHRPRYRQIGRMAPKGRRPGPAGRIERSRGVLLSGHRRETGLSAGAEMVQTRGRQGLCRFRIQYRRDVFQQSGRQTRRFRGRQMGEPRRCAQIRPGGTPAGPDVRKRGDLRQRPDGSAPLVSPGGGPRQQRRQGGKGAALEGAQYPGADVAAGRGVERCRKTRSETDAQTGCPAPCRRNAFRDIPGRGRFFGPRNRGVRRRHAVGAGGRIGRHDRRGPAGAAKRTAPGRPCSGGRDRRSATSRGSSSGPISATAGYFTACRPDRSAIAGRQPICANASMFPFPARDACRSGIPRAENSGPVGNAVPIAPLHNRNTDGINLAVSGIVAKITDRIRIS